MALRLVYKDPLLTFQQLLAKDNSFTIHERNLQKLATEIVYSLVQLIITMSGAKPHLTTLTFAQLGMKTKLYLIEAQRLGL